jgi:hypothetical protein
VVPDGRGRVQLAPSSSLLRQPVATRDARNAKTG